MVAMALLHTQLYRLRKAVETGNPVLIKLNAEYHNTLTYDILPLSATTRNALQRFFTVL